MSMSMYLGRIHCLRPCPCRTTPLISTNATTQASLPDTQFAISDYLVQTCGLSSDQALKSSKYINHLKTPDRPDAVLQFMRQLGLSDSDIRTAVSREGRILRSSVENNWRPNIAKLQDIGFSMDDILGIISRTPGIFVFNFVPKIDFWLGVLGSVENLVVVLKRHAPLLYCNLEKVAVPNLSFLQSECHISARQMVTLLKLDSRLITLKTETLKMKAKRAEDLGFVRSSGMFVHALIVVSSLSQHTLEARLNNLKSLEFSQEEVSLMISRAPKLLGIPEELLSIKMEFLLKETGCDKLDLVQTPTMLMYSLENRLIPRNVVRKLLKSKGSPQANCKFASFLTPTEKRFLEKFVLPYKHAIPGLRQAYTDASAGKIGDI